MRKLLLARAELPALGPVVTLAISMIFVVLTAARGADWVFGSKPGTVSELMLANSVGLHTWGVLLLVAAVGFFAALASKRHFAIWAAHAFLAAIYFGLTISVVQSVHTYGGGLQHVIPPFGGFVWHAALALIMHPLPRRKDHADADAPAAADPAPAFGD